MAEECGLQLERRPQAVQERPESKWPGWWRRPFEDQRRLAERPAYGRIECSCESISRGEIEDALADCRGAATLDGLKRRTRALMGRCQGFNCGVSVARMISRHYGIPLSSVTRHGPGSEFIAEGRCEDAPTHRSNLAPTAPLLPHYRAIVIGAGPAGVGAATGLARRGIAPVLVVDRADQVGGVPAKYEAKPGGVPTFAVWSRGRVMFGQEYAAKLAQQLDRAGAQVYLEAQVTDADPDSGAMTIVSPRGCWTIRADAVVFACGARELTRSERGWIVGVRPARQFYTLQLLELLDQCHALPMRRPAIFGSDLIAYSAAAKLRAAGTSEAAIFDRAASPAAAWIQRRYFQRWTTPAWRAVDGSLTISKSGEGELMLDDDGQRFDGVVFSGELTPNNELLVAAGVEPATRSAAVSRRWRQLSAPQWFVVGAAVGGLHGAEWCYWDGRRASAAVADYIKNLGSR
jgi:NADPH-dependent 2,4-dienoyl-CoA reductase/sulfur reductase-like enzyme